MRAGARRLEAAEVDSPRLSAELLLGRALGCDRAALTARSEDAVPPERARVFEGLVARRASREPIQHILGRTEFWSMSFLTDRRALIPRPETELLVEMALAFLRGRVRPEIADIGTGTGCIALALAHELPEAAVTASDASAEALALAGENARLNGLEGRVRFLRGDMAQPFLAAGLAGRFDVILSNPPYIPCGEIASLQAEVRDHDPRAALDGGVDGLDAYRRLLRETPALLRPEGALMMELGAGQAGGVVALAIDAGWRVERVARDLQGIDRVVIVRRELKTEN